MRLCRSPARAACLSSGLVPGPSDKPSGLSHASSATGEVAKLLKRMGYPEMQGVTLPSSVIDKARTSLAKRLKAIDDLVSEYKNAMTSDALRKNPSPLISRSCPHNWCALIHMHGYRTEHTCQRLCPGCETSWMTCTPGLSKPSQR